MPSQHHPTADDNNHPLMRYFAFQHLPEGILRDTSMRFSNLACDLDAELPNGSEKTTAMRKLLEAKDAAVRSALDLVES